MLTRPQSKTKNVRSNQVRRQLRKRAARAALLALVLFLLLGAAIATRPFSSSLLDDEVIGAWHRATGFTLDFRDATYHLASGRLELSNVRVLDPETGVDLTHIDRVTLGWRWRMAAPPNFLEINQIEIASPTPLVVFLEPGGELAPGPRLQSFLDLFARFDRPPKVSQTSGQPLKVGITKSALYLDARQPGASPSLQRFAGMENLSLSLNCQPGSPSWLLELKGRSWGGAKAAEESSRLNVTVEPRLVGDASERERQFDFRIEAEGLDSRKHWLRPLPFSLSGDSIVAEGMLASASQWERFRLELSHFQGKALEAELTSAGLRLPAANVELRLRAEADLKQESLRIDAIDLKALDSHFQGAIRATLAGDRAFSVEVSDSTLSSTVLNLIQDIFPKQIPRVEFQQGTVRPSFRLVGDGRGVDWRASSGNLRADDLLVQLESLEPQIGPVELEASLTSRALEIGTLNLRAESSRLALSSVSFTRKSTEWEDGLSVEADWTVDLRGEDALQLLPSGQEPLLKDFKMKGALRGHGSVWGDWLPDETEGETAFLNQIESVLKTLQIDGLLRLKEGRFYHPVLPAPIDHLSGSLMLSNRSAQWSDLEGEMLGSKTTITCHLSGKELFWSQPALDLRVEGDVDLSRVPELLKANAIEGDWLDANRRALFEQLRPRGRLEFDAAIKGPLLNPTKLDLSGELEAKGLAIAFDSKAIVGELALHSLRLDMRPDRVTIKEAKGRIREIDLITSGSLTGDGARLQYRATGTLPDFKAAFPPSLRDSGRVAGQVKAKGWVEAKLKPQGPLRAAASPLALLINAATVDVSPSGAGWFDDRFNWDFLATVDALDCHYAHSYMPVEVDRIRGRIHLDRQGLRTDGFVRTDWGRSANGLTSGTIRRASALEPEQSAGARVTPWKKNYVKIKVEARFPVGYVDDWTQYWGPPKSLERKPRQPPENPVSFDPAQKTRYPMGLEVSGSIHADRLLYDKFDFRNVDSKISTRVYRHHPVLLEFSDARGEAFEGKIASNFAFHFRPKKFYWNWDLELENAICEQLIKTYYGKTPSLNGALSGRLFLEAFGKDEATYNGVGRVTLANSRFLGNPIFLAMGKLPGLRSFEDISFTQMKSEFFLEKGTIVIPELTMEGALTNFSAQGSATLDGNLDLLVVYQPLGVVSKIPVLSLFHKISAAASDKMLAVNIKGTLQEPKTSMFNFSKNKNKIQLERDRTAGNFPSTQWVLAPPRLPAPETPQ